MGLNLANYDERARDAIKLFWGNRSSALQRKIDSGKTDAGTRGAVTAGKNMDGFLALIVEIIHANGLEHADICLQRRVLTLPGYFRPTKLWDILVLNKGQLVAAIEMKSQVGSLGNNANNRAEEVIGVAHDFWTAYREGAFGTDAPRPFVGWIMLLEDSSAAHSPVLEKEPHFKIFSEFRRATYAARYDLLCKKLVKEGLYTSAAFITSPATSALTGEYSSLSELASLKQFVTDLAAHIAGVAAS